MMVGLRIHVQWLGKLVSMISDSNVYQFQFGSSNHEAGKNLISDLVMMKFSFLMCYNAHYWILLTALISVGGCVLLLFLFPIYLHLLLLWWCIFSTSCVHKMHPFLLATFCRILFYEINFASLVGWVNTLAKRCNKSSWQRGLMYKRGCWLEMEGEAVTILPVASVCTKKMDRETIERKAIEDICSMLDHLQMDVNRGKMKRTGNLEIVCYMLLFEYLPFSLTSLEEGWLICSEPNGTIKANWDVKAFVNFLSYEVVSNLQWTEFDLYFLVYELIICCKEEFFVGHSCFLHLFCLLLNVESNFLWSVVVMWCMVSSDVIKKLKGFPMARRGSQENGPI